MCHISICGKMIIFTPVPGFCLCARVSPFTVYVVTVRKGNTQWRVFRRFKEWEDLRDRLRGWCGHAPPMPGKVLFGRMRPEVRNDAAWHESRALIRTLPHRPVSRRCSNARPADVRFSSP